MDNMKNGGHAGTAEAENAETMDLLTGMLDAATRCGGESTRDNSEQTAEKTRAEASAPGK